MKMKSVRSHRGYKARGFNTIWTLRRWHSKLQQITMENYTAQTPPQLNFTLPHDLLPRSGYSILSFLMFLNAIFSIFNNVLVIVVTAKNPQLRNPINIFILNLSISDLMIAVCGTTVAVVTNYHGYFYLGEKICIFQGFAVNYFGIISLWSLTILALERYNVVCKPGGALKLNHKRGFLGLTFIWLFCLIWAVAPLFGWSSYGPEGVKTSCSVSWEKRSWSNYSYIIAYFITCFIIPLTIIGFSYYNILKSLYKLNRKIEQQGGKRNSAEEKRAVKMVLAMVTAFLICWLPYTIFALIIVINPSIYISPIAATLPTYFAKTSPVYNPIIYLFFNRQFRECAVECITCGHIRLVKLQEDSICSTAPAECDTPCKINQVAPA
ncbi:pinopsin-like [Pleurodeles waltl]|uniref:pinopsin-like n=1 Tax=Pleurodeles waltl TaxID=8319 RepID=UPI00370954E4